VHFAKTEHTTAWFTPVYLAVSHNGLPRSYTRTGSDVGHPWQTNLAFDPDLLILVLRENIARVERSPALQGIRI
jgi:hypothetical protein